MAISAGDLAAVKGLPTLPLSPVWLDGPGAMAPALITTPRWHHHLWWILATIAAVDALWEPPALTGAWWCTYFLVWLIPQKKYDGSSGSLQRAVYWLAVTCLFAWLFHRTQVAILTTVMDWTLSTSSPRINLLAFPAQTIFAAIVTALLISAPLHRVACKRAVPLAVLVSMPFALVFAGDVLLSPSQWLEKPLRHILLLFDCIFPMLILVEAASLLQRVRSNEGTGGIAAESKSRIEAVRAGRVNPTTAMAMCGATLGLAIWGQAWARPDDLLSASPIVIAAYACVFPMTAWVFMISSVVAWRSMVRAKASRPGGRNSLVVFGQAIVLIAVAGVGIRLVFLESPITGALIAEAVAMGGEPRWSIERTELEGEVRLSGEFQRGMAQALEKKLADHPGVHQLELDSPGGSIPEGFAIARIIEERGLFTVVRNECSSACTLAFVASPQRRLDDGARLGFHRYKFVSWLDTPDLIYEYFEEKGIDGDFARKGFKVPNHEMWYPDVDELYSADVITNKAHRHRDAG